MNMIDSYSVDGFRLTNNTKVLGPCIIFPNAVLKWCVTGVEDLTGRETLKIEGVPTVPGTYLL